MLCEREVCERVVCDKVVCDKVVYDKERIVEAGGRRTEADGSAQQKTRTPHKDVGNGKGVSTGPKIKFHKLFGSRLPGFQL